MTSRKPDRSRPEQQFFEDPAIDRLMGTVVALATEVFVLQSRLRALEDQLAESNAVDRDALHRAADARRLATEARDYAEHLMHPLLGLQDAAGPTG